MKNSRVMLEWDETFKEVSEHVGNWHNINWTSATVFGNLGSALPGHYPAINFVIRCSFDECDVNPKQRVNASSYIYASAIHFFASIQVIFRQHFLVYALVNNIFIYIIHSHAQHNYSS